MTRSPKCWACHENCNSSCENDAKVLRLPHKTTFGTWSNRLECHKVPRLPRKTTWQPAWKPSKRRGFAASPKDAARPYENQRLETRHVGASKRAFRARLPPIFELSSFKIDVFLRVFLWTSKFAIPQNRCFVRGFRQFSSHLTKCHACHGICTLSPLDAALTMRSAKSTQHDTSEVLRLPCKMTMDTSKVLRLARKLQLILRKRRKSIAHATQNDFRKPRLPRETQLCDAGNIQKWPFRRTYHRPWRERLRTVADGCEHKRNVERTHPQPADPQSETGTLATHSGKINEQVSCQSMPDRRCLKLLRAMKRDNYRTG